MRSPGFEKELTAVPGLRTLAIRSSAVNFALTVVLKVLLFGQVVVFSRLFTPDQYGQLSTVLLVLSFATLLGRMGLNEALVRESKNPREVMDTAFTLSLWIAAGLCVLLVVSAPLMAVLFKRPSVTEHVRMLAILVFVIPFELPGMVWIKDLQFGMSKIASFADLIFSTGITLILRLGFGYGVMSLVIGRLAGFLAAQVVAWILVPYRPRLEFHREHAIALYHYGWPLVVGSLCNFAIYQMDDFFVRVFWGDRSLSFYTLAFALPYYLKQFTDLLVGSLLPIYAKLKDEIERTRTAFIEINRYLSISMVPCGLALYFFAEPLTLLFFGPKWLPTVPALKVFAWGFTIETLGGYSWGLLVVARGKTKLSMIPKIVSAVSLLTIGAYLIWKYGIIGGAWAMLIHAVLSVAIIRPLILYKELGSLYYLKDSWKPVGAALLAGYAAVFVAAHLPAGVIGLVASGSLYFLLYAVVYILLDRPIVQETRTIAVALAGRRTT